MEERKGRRIDEERNKTGRVERGLYAWAEQDGKDYGRAVDRDTYDLGE